MAKHDELRQLIKIASLYYDEGVNQSVIAKNLNLSQSQVSRALNRCVKEGWVKISVVQPPNIFVQIENEIQNIFGCDQVIVVDVPDGASQDNIRTAIGSSAAHYMQTTLQANELIGVSSWSETIRAMVDNMHPLPGKAKGVIQILGGVGHNGNLQANLLTHSMANLLDTKSYLLPATSIERSVEDKKRNLESPEMKEVVDKFDEVTLALVGIGSIDPSMLLRNSGNVYQEEMTNELTRRGAVGDICLHYFDSNGLPVLSEQEDPVTAMSLSQIKRCDRVVGLAGGLDKVQAIKGALKGGYLDVLITDRITATALLENS